MNAIKSFFNRPALAIPSVGVVILIIGAILYFRMDALPPYTYAVAQTGTVPGAITLVGTVAPSEEVDLAFLKSGTVATLSAQTGQKISAGTQLASLSDQGTLGQLNQAKGAYEAAEANYQKVLEGASTSTVAVGQAAVAMAQSNLAGVQSQNDTAVANAYRTLLSSNLQAVATSGAAMAAVSPIISGTYTGTDTGQYIITPYAGGAGQYFSVSGLESGQGQIGQSAAQPLGTHGLFIQFPSGFSVNSSQMWIVNIPNTQASTYASNENAYQAALTARDQAVNNAQAALAQAQAQLTNTQSVARPADIEAAQAQVDSAQGAYQAAQGAYDNDFITAPIDGTITFVNVNIGQNTTPNQTVIGMTSSGTFQIDAYIDQDYLNRLSLGATTTVTFASIPGQTFTARIADIDSGAEVVGSSAEYKVTFDLQGNDSQITSGLQATITIPGTDKSDVLTIPHAALINKDGAYSVLVKQGNSLVQVPVTVGLIGTDTVEIQNGLQAGDTVALIGQ